MSRKTLFWVIYLPLLVTLLPVLALFGFLSVKGPGNFIVFSLALLAVAALTTWFSARRLRAALGQVHSFVQSLTAGEAAPRPWIEGPQEFTQLALSLRQKANAWSTETRELRRRHQEQKAVLSSMWGGVLAIDHQERILNLNKAAAELFGLDPDTARGRHVQEVIRHLDLQEFLSRLLASDVPLEGEIIFRPVGTEERYLQVHGSFLQEESGETLGALVVLHDVTDLRRLEKIRRDFVANVSHELRTPITSIRGFVETLLDGALEDPEQARNFLTIIARQSERLNAIIEDLLALSRIEREAERQEITFGHHLVAAVIGAAVQTCEHQATEKTVPIAVSCPEDLSVRINGPLIEQALVNLLSNAIKYSEEGSPVQISAYRQEAFVCIQVRDHGKGIGRQHLDRLFERFYRVDKGRSRPEGGTGLGLAIVKHIMLAHHGRVLVESQPGKGSTFTLQVPL
ncbi:MAG: ATP-binding protein [Deltaproteobacteria bacterium]|jgi:two-component system phosphate regulon sensor histidine kinase PhoR